MIGGGEGGGGGGITGSVFTLHCPCYRLHQVVIVANVKDIARKKCLVAKLACCVCVHDSFAKLVCTSCRGYNFGSRSWLQQNLLEVLAMPPPPKKKQTTTTKQHNNYGPPWMYLQSLSVTCISAL